MKWFVKGLIGISILLLLSLASLFVLAQRHRGVGQNQASVEISRGVHRVGRYVFDLRSLKIWVGWLDVTAPSEEPLENGSRFRVRAGSTRRPFDLDGSVLDVVPDSRLVFELRAHDPSMPFNEEADLRLEPLGDRTLLTMTVDSRWRGLWILAEPIITASGQRRLEEDVLRLKGLVEAAP